MTRFLLISSFLLNTIIAFSQADFRVGYVVLQSGDSIKGDVKYTDITTSYIKCVFRTIDDKQVSYTPDQIRSYGYVNDKVFLSMAIMINNESTLVFVEELVRGILGLYKFEDRYWIKRSEEEFFELMDVEKEVTVKGNTMLKRSREYRGQINMLMYDCIELKSRIERLNLYEKEVTLLVEDYNRCKGSSSTTFKASKPWVKTVARIQAGLNLSLLNVDNSQPGYLSGQYDLSLSLMAGLGFDFSFPRVVNEGLSLRVEAIYNTSNYSKTINEFNQMTASINQIKVPLGLRYSFTERKVTPFIMGGVSYGFHIESEAAYVSGATRLVLNEVLASNQFGLWFSTGFNKSISKKINGSLELRYERTNGIFINGSTLNNIQLVLGIGLK